MTANSKLDALHAEMLGDLQELLQLLERVRGELPDVLATFKREGEGAAGTVREAFENFHAQSLALAEFMKARRQEVLADLEASTKKNVDVVRQGLAEFKNLLWAVLGVGTLNLVVLVSWMVVHR